MRNRNAIGALGALAMISAGCSGGSKGGTTTDPTVPPVAAPKLCVDLNATAGSDVEVEAAPEPMLSIVPEGASFGDPDLMVLSTELDGVLVAVLWKCDEAACSGRVAKLASESGAMEEAPDVMTQGFSITAEVALPHAADGFAELGGLEVDLLAARDGDGDGRGELWVFYRVTGEPEAAIGSTTEEYLAVVDPGKLTVLAAVSVSTVPDASVLETCEGRLSEADVTCDDTMDLLLTRTCCTEDGDCSYERSAHAGGGDSWVLAGEAMLVTPPIEE